MADNPGRLLLVKAKVDLTAFKDSLKQMQNMVKSVNLALAPKAAATVSTGLKETLDAERQKQTAKQATLKVGDSSVVQEKSLRAELMRTMELRRQETVELQKQVTALREKVAAENALLHVQHEGVRQQTQRTIQQERALRQPTSYQGVIPTVVRSAPAVAQTVASAGASTGQSVETAAYQASLMRQMRLASVGKAPGGMPPASGLTASLTGGLMGGLGAGMPASEAARLQDQRARDLRLQQTVQRAIAVQIPTAVTKPSEVRTPSRVITPVAIKQPIETKQSVEVLPRLSMVETANLARAQAAKDKALRELRERTAAAHVVIPPPPPASLVEKDTLTGRFRAKSHPTEVVVPPTPIVPIRQPIVVPPLPVAAAKPSEVLIPPPARLVEKDPLTGRFRAKAPEVIVPPPPPVIPPVVFRQPVKPEVAPVTVKQPTEVLPQITTAQIMAQQRARELRMQTAPILQAPIPQGGWVEKDPATGHFRAKQQTPVAHPPSSPEQVRAQRAQESAFTRMTVQDAAAQVRLTQVTEGQKKALVLGSLDVQRDALRAQLRSQQISFVQYISQMKVLVAQEKATKLAAIAAEEKALLALLQTKLKVNAITPQAFQTQSSILNAQMGMQRTAVENASSRQLLMFNRQQPQLRGGKGEEGSLLRGMGMGITRSLGGGLVGSIATGLMFGGGTLMVFDQAARGIEHMMHSMKEFILASGPMQQVNAQFQTLAKGAGIDAPAFMDKLRASTHGLVDHMDLMRVATGALRSNLKLSDTDILRLVKDTTELARVQGKSVPQAMHMLDTALQTGQMRGVARFLGLNQRELMMNVAPRGATIQQREQLQMTQVRGAMESRLAKTGIAPETMTESFQKLKQAQSEFWEDFGQGMATSTGARAFIASLSKMADGIGGLSGMAKKLGETLGEAFAFVGRVLLSVIEDFGSLAKIIGLVVSQGVAGITSLGGAVGGLQGQLTGMKSVFSFMFEVFNQMELGAKKLGSVFVLLAEVRNPWIKFGDAVDHYNASVGKADEHATSQTFEMNKALVGPPTIPLEKAKADLTAYRKLLETANKEIAATGGVPKTGPISTEMASRIQKRDEYQRGITTILLSRPELTSADTSGVTTGGIDPATRAQNMRDAQAALKITELVEDEKLSVVKRGLEAQRDAQQQMLKSGETDLFSYVQKMKGYVEAEKNAELSRIDAVEKANKEMRQAELATGGITQKDYLNATAVAAKEAAKQKSGVEEEAAKKTMALTDQVNQDKVAAVAVAENREIQIRKDALALQQEMIKDAYDKQLLSVNTYLASERAAIEETYKIEEDAASEKYYRTEQGQKDLEQLAADYTAAQAKREKSVTTQANSEVQKRVARAQQDYETVAGFLQARQQLQVAQRGGQELPVAQQRDDLATQIAALSKAIATMAADIATAPAGQRMQLAPQLMAKQQELIPLQVKQAQLNEGPIPLSSVGDLASALGQLPQGTTRAFKGVGAIPELMQWMTKQQQAQKEGAVPGIISGPMQNLGLLFHDLFTNAHGLPDAFRNLEQSLLPAIQAIASFASAVQQGPVAGAIAGAGMGKMLFSGGGMFSGIGSLLSGLHGKKQSDGSVPGPGQPVEFVDKGAPTGTSGVEGVPPGMGSSGVTSEATSGASSAVGGAVSSMVTKLASSVGSSLQGLGAMAGPIGAVAGAAFGAILSSIVEKKQRATEKYLLQMQLDFQRITLSLQTGQIGMNEAITEAIALRNDVQAQMNNSSKKKRSAYMQELQGFNQQIQQLQAQQVQQVQQMYEQVNTVGASPLNAFTQQLQQIIQQYAQFAGAARNTQDLASATEWLTKSLQGYAQTQLTAMNQAETGAIQDAIQLNDLYTQRNQLLQQEANTEYNIMTQGILTRQQTTAQSKMEQIALMKQQDAIQLQNLNEQIGAAQFRVDAEKKIFNLATTRVGLEMQLLAMQNQSTTLQMAQVAALQQVVMAMQSGNFQNILTGGLNVNQNAPGYQAFWNLLKALGMQPSDLMNQFLKQFNDMSGYGFGGFSIVSGGG